MEMLKGMEIVNLALYIKKHKTLAIADLHLGYEEHLIKKGFLVPGTQFKDIYTRLENILSSRDVKTVVITGDFKHEFGRIYESERKNILKIISLIGDKRKLIIIKGNHDVSLPFLAKKIGVEIFETYTVGDVLFCHGDEIPENLKKSKIIIIGHEHPALGLREKNKYENYKCFLKGKWKDKILIVLPAFHTLTIGTDVLMGELLSPFLAKEKLGDFEAYVIEDNKTYDFGKLKKLINHP